MLLRQNSHPSTSPSDEEMINPSRVSSSNSLLSKASSSDDESINSNSPIDSHKPSSTIRSAPIATTTETSFPNTPLIAYDKIVNTFCKGFIEYSKCFFKKDALDNFNKFLKKDKAVKNQALAEAENIATTLLKKKADFENYGGLIARADYPWNSLTIEERAILTKLGLLQAGKYLRTFLEEARIKKFIETYVDDKYKSYLIGSKENNKETVGMIESIYQLCTLATTPYAVQKYAEKEHQHQNSGSDLALKTIVNGIDTQNQNLLQIKGKTSKTDDIQKSLAIINDLESTLKIEYQAYNLKYAEEKTHLQTKKQLMEAEQQITFLQERIQKNTTEIADLNNKKTELKTALEKMLADDDKRQQMLENKFTQATKEKNELQQYLNTLINQHASQIAELEGKIKIQEKAIQNLQTAKDPLEQTKNQEIRTLKQQHQNSIHDKVTEEKAEKKTVGIGTSDRPCDEHEPLLSPREEKHHSPHTVNTHELVNQVESLQHENNQLKAQLTHASSTILHQPRKQPTWPKWAMRGALSSVSTTLLILAGAVGLCATIWNPAGWALMGIGALISAYCFYKVHTKREHYTPYVTLNDPNIPPSPFTTSDMFASCLGKNDQLTQDSMPTQEACSTTTPLNHSGIRMFDIPWQKPIDINSENRSASSQSKKL